MSPFLHAPLSFEIFPPRSAEAEGTLKDTLARLLPLRPAFVSVTYGAGGSTRERTQKLVQELQGAAACPAMPHLTCVGHREAEILRLLEGYAAAGVTRILALRGDLPGGGTAAGGGSGTGAFEHAADLIRCIQRFNAQGLHPVRGGFQIAAACYPEGHPATPNRMAEMDHLKAKVDAGVDFLITQAFFDNHVFHDFRERCTLAGVRVPVLAGVLPLPNRQTLLRMAELAGNMRYPARLLKALQRAGEDAQAFQAVAAHHAAEQCHDLLHHGVDGLHLYPLNRAAPVLAVLERLGHRGG